MLAALFAAGALLIAAGIAAVEGSSLVCKRMLGAAISLLIAALGVFGKLLAGFVGAGAFGFLFADADKVCG